MDRVCLLLVAISCVGADISDINIRITDCENPRYDMMNSFSRALNLNDPNPRTDCLPRYEFEEKWDDLRLRPEVTPLDVFSNIGAWNAFYAKHTQGRHWAIEQISAIAHKFICLDRIASGALMIRRDVVKGTPVVAFDYDTGVGTEPFISTSRCCLDFKTRDSCPPGVSPDYGYIYTEPRRYRPSDDGIWDHFGEPGMICAACFAKDAGPKTCKDGEYASGYIRVSHGFVLNNIMCIPCAPGTWNTCMESPTCIWNIPTSEANQVKNQPIWLIGNKAPVGQCYPCEFAGNKVHYAESPSKYSLIPALGTKTPLPWYCPGNTDGNDGVPRRCLSPFVGSDSKNIRCVCGPGTFQEGVDQCLECTAGNFCLEGLKQECADHTYQDQSGATTCRRCTYDGTSTGVPLVNCPGANLMRQCVGEYKSQAPGCANCNQCKNFYSKDSSRVPCYT